MVLALKPIQLPANDNGTLIRNQIRMTISIVVKGTAPEACRAQTKRFKKKKTEKMNRGPTKGVYKKSRFQPCPSKNL